MFHGNFREKNTQLCHFLAMFVVLDLQLCWICNPTPLNISICDASNPRDFIYHCSTMLFVLLNF